MGQIVFDAVVIILFIAVGVMLDRQTKRTAELELGLMVMETAYSQVLDRVNATDEEMGRLKEAYSEAQRLIRASAEAASADAELSAEAVKSAKLFQDGLSAIINYDYRNSISGGNG